MELVTTVERAEDMLVHLAGTAKRLINDEEIDLTQELQPSAHQIRL